MKTTSCSSLRSALLALAFVCISITSGCSQKVSVSGHVTFPDGSPLTMGSVIFETDTYQVFGSVDAEGFYSLAEIKPGDKIKPGEYRVRVMATTGGSSDGERLTYHVHPKFSVASTSGLVCMVKGNTVFDIKVEKP